MICRSCGSERLNKFPGELAIHFPGLKDLNKPVVLVFPEIWVCFDCGNTGFSVPESELRVLAAANNDATVPATFSPSSSGTIRSSESQQNESTVTDAKGLDPRPPQFSARSPSILSQKGTPDVRNGKSPID